MREDVIPFIYPVKEMDVIISGSLNPNVDMYWALLSDDNNSINVQLTIKPARYHNRKNTFL